MTKCFSNATLVQFDPPMVERGSLRVVGELIAEVGAAVKPQVGDEVVDCAGSVVTPGLVNGHTHLYSALATGMPAPPQAPTNFHEILTYIWWRLDRAHDLASVEASGLVGALTALRSGTTTLIDHHASPNVVDGSLTALEAGIAKVGCRAVTCYEVTDRNAPDEAAQGVAENVRYIKACRASGNQRFAGMVGAHASFTLSEDSLSQCADACRQTKAGLHIHVAEDPIDAKLTSERFDCGLIDRLERHGILELPNSIIAHGTHLSEADLIRLNECGETISVAHNPNSNMNNGVGYTPIAKLAKPPLLGTDGIGADLWREARTALFKSHDATRAIPFDWPLKMLAASAKLASSYLGCRLGVLESGAVADLVITRYEPATPLTPENLAGHLIYAMGPEFVRDVMVGGDWCLRNGEFTSCNETDVRRSACEETRRLYDRLAQIGAEE